MSAPTSIKRLSRATANFLSASQIFREPADILVKLIQNSVQGGAQRVEVILHMDDRSQDLSNGDIRIVDNGRGISKAKLISSLFPKTNSVYDQTGSLVHLATLSCMTIRSYPENELHGFEIIVRGNKIMKERSLPQVESSGTTVKIEDLYFQLPIRRKMIYNKDNTLKKMRRSFENISIIFHWVYFTLKIKDRQPIFLPKRDTSSLRIEDILGSLFSRYVLDVFGNLINDNCCSIQGVLLSPSVVIASSERQVIYLNGYSISRGHDISQFVCLLLSNYRKQLIVMEKPGLKTVNNSKPSSLGNTNEKGNFVFFLQLETKKCISRNSHDSFLLQNKDGILQSIFDAIHSGIISKHRELQLFSTSTFYPRSSLMRSHPSFSSFKVNKTPLRVASNYKGSQVKIFSGKMRGTCTKDDSFVSVTKSKKDEINLEEFELPINGKDNFSFSCKIPQLATSLTKAPFSSMKREQNQPILEPVRENLRHTSIEVKGFDFTLDFPDENRGFWDSRQADIRFTTLPPQSIRNYIGNFKIAAFKRSKQSKKHSMNRPISIVSTKITKKMLSDSRVIGQVDNKYLILYVKENGLLIAVDQHAADERIRLEDMMKKIDQNQSTFSLKIHRLETPEKLFLTHDEAQLMKEHKYEIRKWGFEYSLYETQGDTNKVNYNGALIFAVPIVMGVSLSSTDLKDFLNTMYNLSKKRTVSSNCVRPPAIRRILKSKACRGAIMFGKSLSTFQITKIINNLKQCNFPFICAHGRPSVVPLCVFHD